MKKLFISILTLTILLSITMGAEALESKSMYRQNGMSANAGWTETNGNEITYTDLYVTETEDGTDVYLSVWTVDTKKGSESYKSGCLFTEDDVFSIDRKLSSASLSEVEIEVYGEDMSESETFTVSADWTGKGDITKGSTRYVSKSGDYIWRSSDSSSYRDATATGSINTIDGVSDLGASSTASLNMFKSAYIDMNK